MNLSKLLKIALPVVVTVYIAVAFTSTGEEKKEVKLNQHAENQLPEGHPSIKPKGGFPAEGKGCLAASCHAGIEPIRAHDSQMMKQIYKKGAAAGDPNGCVVCHGGNPQAFTKEEAHRGTTAFFKVHEGPKEFYPDPGSSWINKNTCGQCHKEQVRSQYNSLMMTEQGKIQGTLWSFGGLEGYNHNVGNYATSDVDPHQRLGSEAYKRYMKELHDKNPGVYPSKMKKLPPAPTAEEVEKNPKLAAYTYLRQECLRCHTGSKGRMKRGDYRGIGCSSCHIPYSNGGLYEGGDSSIDKKQRGHLLVHSIQAGRASKVTVHGKSYSGVPVETCTTCHNRGKRIGVSYQGLMETAYNPTFDNEGNAQPKLHTKHYLHLQEDIHYKKGMLCQDCHTTNDLHGDGFLTGATLAPVEIECQDCHGTTKKFPWELPQGYGDEFDTLPKEGAPRGLADSIPSYLKKGTHYAAADGFLLTARGNPYKNVVRTGDSVLVHLASGKDLVLNPLKKLKAQGKLSKEALVAMDKIGIHTERLECYTCHATWAPQCYGCHVKIDYSKNFKNVDWLAAASDHDEHGLGADARGETGKYLIDGKVSETRSYLRWENPPLSQNGEGRISPTIPGCQVTVSVIGKDGKALIKNHIFKIPNVEGAGEEGQLAIDMSPVQPHTVQEKARPCESCHTNAGAMGYGIGGGKYFGDPSKDLIVDLMTADGQVIPTQYKVQKPAIENLKYDWSRYVTEKGKQLQTVGHHFKLSRPLNNEERSKLDRRGVCLSCHQSIPDGDLAVSAMSHIAKYSGVQIDNKTHQGILLKLTIVGAWLQVGGGLIVAVVILSALFFFFKRRKKR